MSLAVVAMCALLYLPALAIGFYADDFYWLPALHPPPELTTRVAPYFITFETPLAEAYWRARGVYFWWADHDFRWTLMRPVSNFLLELQWGAFKTHAVGYHVVSLLIYLGLVWSAWLLYRRSAPAGVALLALFLFATHFGHLQTVWWMCNQHSLFSALGGLLALLVYLRWREDEWLPGLLLYLPTFAAALLFGETALAMTGYFIAFEIWGARGSRWRRAANLLPLAALLAGYLALHHALGYTSRGSLLYLDPVREARAFLEASPSRFPALLDGLWNVLPADFWGARPALRPLMSGAAVIVCALIASLLRTAWRGLEPAARRTVSWMGIGALLALVPGLASPPGGRLLLCASLGSSVVLAVIFQAALSAWRCRERGGWGRAYLAGVAPLLVLDLLLVPLALPAVMLGVGRLTTDQVLSFQQAEIDDHHSPDQDFIVLNMPGPISALTFLSARNVLLGSPLPHSWTLLSSAPYPERVTRTDAYTLELEVLQGTLIGEGLQQLFRPASWPVRAGAVFDLNDYQVRVLTADETGPTRVAFRFRQALDAPSYQMLVWRAGKLRKNPMLPIGETVTVPAAASPFGPGM